MEVHLQNFITDGKKLSTFKFDIQKNDTAIYHQIKMEDFVQLDNKPNSI